ncbi:hypothetical protein MKJ01_15090 [Chryseobacterium sp. SSA4.19]|uniref:hypothetical protein n=1 Tax=Chryseobacterium sp. SSA4.19 TaxID=2919915 RepID=UPI001F4DA818|nr:hypothetical protein [Chryseobacterium sp. SSA4.19]MCJ8155092.1 hypothetical protein [Chryseobacterium sp. SSA4.19]
MNFRTRNIHTWMIIEKCKQMDIECTFVVPQKEDFLALKKNGKTIMINRAISPSLRYIPNAITEDKITCNYILQQNGFPIPPFIFIDQVDDSALDFLSTHSVIVAKPFDTNKGVEIHMNIVDPYQLESAVSHIKSVSQKAILQKQAKGRDYRILLINHEVVGVLWNEWPFITGNGENSISELIEIENHKRFNTKVDVYGKQTEMLVEISEDSAAELLKSNGYSIDDILPYQEKRYVGNCGNGWSGALAHDVTDDINPQIIKKAIEITRFLDIDVAGLDIRCEDITLPYEQSDFNVIEVNTRPSIVDHEFPTSGKPRNVTEIYLNYLFTE